jgi:DNA repair exonuclease SbcCD ATPase subunit
MALPESIQKQIEEANEIERQIAEMTASLDGESPMQVEQAPVVMADIEEPAAPELVADQASPEPTPVEEVVQVDPNDETWEHKYRSAQGRYNAEVPRLHKQIKELSGEVAQLQQRLDQITATPAQPEISPVDELRAKYGEAYGDDLAKDTEALARAIATKELEKAAKRVEELERQMQETQASGAQAQFFSTLAARVPNWQDVNAEQGWLAWLGEFDPLVGATRQDVLDYAQSQADADRVAAIFETYLLTRQQAPRAAPQAPVANTGYLQEQLVPRSQGTAPSVSQPNRRIYTEAEISQLLDVRNMRKLPMDQQRAIRHDIDLAVAEGRIAA